MYSRLPGTIFSIFMNIFYNPPPEQIPTYQPFQFAAKYIPFTGTEQNGLPLALVGNVTIGNVTYRMHFDVPNNMDTVLVGERAGLANGTQLLNNTLKYIRKESTSVPPLIDNVLLNKTFTLSPTDVVVEDFIHTGVNNETIKQPILVLNNFSDKNLENYFESAPFDGVLSLRTTSIGNNNSFLNNTLAGRNESNVVTFWMQGKSTDDLAVLSFGSFDSTHCSSNWIEIPQRDPYKGLWSFYIRTISFNHGTMLPNKTFIPGITIHEESKRVTSRFIEHDRNDEQYIDEEQTYSKDMTGSVSSHPVEQLAAIRIGQASSKVPKKHLVYMADITGAEKKNVGDKYYSVSCSRRKIDQYLIMGLDNDQNIVLAPADYIIEMKKDECFLAFEEDSNPPEPGSPTWTLGGHFFSGRCVALDIMKNTISFTWSVPNTMVV